MNKKYFNMFEGVTEPATTPSTLDLEEQMERMEKRMWDIQIEGALDLALNYAKSGRYDAFWQVMDAISPNGEARSGVEEWLKAKEIEPKDIKAMLYRDGKIILSLEKLYFSTDLK